MDYHDLPFRAEYRTYRVRRSDREPLLQFIVDGLRASGCTVLFASDPAVAPFRLVLETSDAERIGVVAYAFRANRRPTKNRPTDERRFQIKYGSDSESFHEIWQDPLGLHVTLLLGIDLEDRFFVSADPRHNNPTRFFKSIEFKDHHATQILERNWCAWERESRQGRAHPAEPQQFEVLVGGRQQELLRLIRFEREAAGEDQGHRHWLADRPAHRYSRGVIAGAAETNDHIHSLIHEFELDDQTVLDLIQQTPRLKMAVRGWIAEEHLRRYLEKVPGVTDCVRMTGDRDSDIRLRYRGSEFIVIECKNTLRQKNAQGIPRLDFQRGRNSKSDPCSRFYAPSDFDIVAACLHAVTDRWEFRFHTSSTLRPHEHCPHKLHHRVLINSDWSDSIESCLHAVAQVKGNEASHE